MKPVEKNMNLKKILLFSVIIIGLTFLVTNKLISAKENKMGTVEERLHSTIDKLEPKDFSYYFTKLDGISEEQLKQHYELYKRYVAKVNEVGEKLGEADKTKANLNYSAYRSLSIEYTHNFNGAILHELYFSNLTDKDTQASEELRTIIERDFCTWENYIDDLVATAKASRAGWAITAFNYRDGKIHNFAIDQHNMHVPITVRPLLVMDTWEHAFMIDYGIKKDEYIDAFLRNINWHVMSMRLDSALKHSINFEEHGFEE